MPASGYSFYGDESGSHGEGTFVLSGYLGRDTDWSEFEKAWHAVLQDSSIGSKLDYFHMRECYVTNWRMRLLPLRGGKPMRNCTRSLTLYARSYDLSAYASSPVLIDWEIFKRATSDQIKEIFYSPYLFAFGTLVIEAARCVKDACQQQEPIYFFMDDQIPLIEKSVAGQFAHAKLTRPDEMAKLFDAITFRSDRFCYPLQAADLIAWQRHRRELNLAEDRGERPERKKLHNAVPLDQPFMFPYNEAGLVEFCNLSYAPRRVRV